MGRQKDTVKLYGQMTREETVGAVALDLTGDVAAGASTGGIAYMLPGRVGDTPVIGCGVYADDEAGAVLQRINFKAGLMNGEMEFFQQDVMLFKSTYKDGKLDGVSTTFDETGKPLLQAHYKEGKLDGESHWFAPDGKPLKRSQFRNGQLEGITVEYHPGGKPHVRSEYKSNKLHGEMIEYAEDGKVKSRVLFRAGQPVPTP